jgi:uncharacterized integral membrane protein
MTLLVFVLLVVAALAVAVRIVQSRSTIGVALIGVVVLGAMAGMAWQLSAILPPIGAAYAAGAEEADDESPDAVADESEVSTPSSDDDAITPANEPYETAIEIETRTNVVREPPPPDWVESEGVQTGDTYLVAVSSGPREDKLECRRALDEELDKAVDAYVDKHLEKVCFNNIKASTFVNYELSYIKDNLVKDTHQEVIRVSFGPMHQMHALLEFGSEFQKDLDVRGEEIDKRWRLTGTALAVGFVLALLGVVFGYFRLDTATRGYYAGRLRLASAVVILTLIVVGVLLAKHIL